MSATSLQLKPSNLEGSMILNAHHSKAGDLQDIENSEKEWHSNLKEWSADSIREKPELAAQISRYAVNFDGQL